MFETIEPKRKKFIWLIGTLYGVILTIFGIGGAGDGHGTYWMMGLYSSPFYFLGVPPAFLGTILLWSVVGWLIQKKQKLKIFIVMAIHYLGIVFLLSYDFFQESERVNQITEKYPDYFIPGYFIYGIGQAVIWFYLILVKEQTDKLL